MAQEKPHGDLIDFMDPRDMTDEMLLEVQDRLPLAAEELRRRIDREALGEEIDDDRPLSERSDRTLLKQAVAGDDEAMAEYERRYKLPPKKN